MCKPGGSNSWSRGEKETAKECKFRVADMKFLRRAVDKIGMDKEKIISKKSFVPKE